jgi:hypothetical protein
MMRKMILAGLMTAFATAAMAQDDSKKVEISASAGWTFSDGINGPAIKVGNGGVYTRVDPLNAFSWGARGGILVGAHSEVGILYDRQSTDLDLGGTASLRIASVSVRNYHGYFAFNFLGRNSSVRPYLLAGFGATQYSLSEAATAGALGTGNTKFSPTGAMGIKFFPAGKTIGLRVEGRWTPTPIGSSATGFWCDSYWGCYTDSKRQYSKQAEWSGGIILRF